MRSPTFANAYEQLIEELTKRLYSYREPRTKRRITLAAKEKFSEMKMRGCTVWYWTGSLINHLPQEFMSQKSQFPENKEESPPKLTATEDRQAHNGSERTDHVQIHGRGTQVTAFTERRLL